jgi:Flp pilus assembly pilin Flp
MKYTPPKSEPYNDGLDEAMMKRILNFLISDEGATGAEYAVMVSLIAVTIIFAVAALGLGAKGLFEKVPSF